MKDLRAAGMKAADIRRARHQLSVIKARRSAVVPTDPEPSPARLRALGIGIGESIYRTTTSTGRPMPSRSHGFGLLVTLAQWAILGVAVLLLAVAFL